MTPEHKQALTELTDAINSANKTIRKNELKFNCCIASISGALDGLEFDNTSDVVEKSVVIEQLSELLGILNK